MIKDYLKAGYPAICVLTQEPHRAENLLSNDCEGWECFSWDCIQGIRKAREIKVVEEIRDPVEAINWLNMHHDTVLIAHNLHLFMDIPEVIQSIQNGVIRWKGTGCALIMISPMIHIRNEVNKLFPIIDLPLPDNDELNSLQFDLCNNLNIKVNRKASRAARGLTELEAEAALSFSLIKKGYCSTAIVSALKANMLRKAGLDLSEPATIKDVGGLDQLKAFISKRSIAYESGNEYLPRLKGLLLVGIPGTGKSLSCKATASILGWPLIKLDIGSLKGSMVGESERKMREATQVIDAFGEVIVWIDEVEKVRRLGNR